MAGFAYCEWIVPFQKNFTPPHLEAHFSSCWHDVNIHLILSFSGNYQIKCVPSITECPCQLMKKQMKLWQTIIRETEIAGHLDTCFDH
jgi:hypothetical protein